MSCVACYFDDAFQNELKRKCFGNNRYENKLYKYREIFIEALKKLNDTNSCSCNFGLDNQDYINWTNNLLSDLKINIKNIEDIFDSIINIYLLFIKKDQKISLDEMWKFIEDNEIANGSAHPINTSNLLFRGRKKNKSYDIKEIKNYFHIPFNLRKTIKNQRFSINGQPMLYLCNSIYTVSKELNSSISDLGFGTFSPKYYIYYHKMIYELNNSFYEVIVKTLPGLFAAGGKLDYNDSNYRPNKYTIIKDIKKSILSYICTFPVEIYDSFIEEYVIPQMLTTTLLNHGYNGLSFPSTKSYTEIKGNHIFSNYNKNTAFFVTYFDKDNYDLTLLDSFYTFTLNGKEKFRFTIKEILNKAEDIFTKTRKSSHNNNDYILPLVNMKLYIEYLENCIINGNKYFNTEYGKIELEFYNKLIDKLDKHIIQ